MLYMISSSSWQIQKKLMQFVGNRSELWWGTSVFLIRGNTRSCSWSRMMKSSFANSLLQKIFTGNQACHTHKFNILVLISRICSFPKRNSRLRFPDFHKILSQNILADEMQSLPLRKSKNNAASGFAGGIFLFRGAM